MRIVNIMISKTLGGVEQAFLDYNQALLLAGNDVLSVVHKKTKLFDKLSMQKGLNVQYINFNQFNYILIWSLYKSFKQFKADVIITHSKKAIPILRVVASLLHVPLIGVSHNPKYKLVNKCDAIFSITQYQKDIFIKQGFSAESIFVIPNSISDIKPYQKKEWHNPPIIGTMGRFDPMKGFDTYLKALGILKKQHISFQAVLGGDIQKAYPEEKAKYLQIVAENNLQDNVKFIGWVKNKEDFYKNIDVFVLSSNYEPFGIVLLEAMSMGIPIISSDAEGPSEIFKDNQDCVSMFAKGDEFALAEKLKTSLQNFEETQNKAQRAWNLCSQKYTIPEISRKLNTALQKYKELI